MKIISFICIMLFGFSMKAHSALLVEPYLGYQTMTSNLKTGSSLGGLNLKLEGSGLGYGLRLGYSKLVFAALDLGLAVLDTRVTEGVLAVTPGTSGHFTTGATLGLNLPLVRPYFGYILQDESRGADSGLKGSGIKAGIGFSFIPLVVLNLEYYSVTHNKYAAPTEVSLPDANSYESATMTGAMLNASFPVNF